ncbi:MAG: trigger factor [Rickettsiales bacterium]|jgi:trigger factor|nr:trigger factor [Rickettsiales bacterium]
MQPVKEKIKGIKYELSFEIPVGDFEAKLSGELAKFAETHQERGFRKGHVPMEVIRSKYETRFVDGARNALINETLSGYTREKGLSLAASPKVSVDSFMRGEPLKFSAVFEIMPKLKEIDFSKIAVEKFTASASDKEIDEALQNIADSRHTAEDIKERRKTRKGDIAVIDFTGSVDGAEFDGGKGADYPLELGSGSFVPGFEDQLVGRSKGDDVDVSVTFPKDYGHAALAGKKALFKVKIKNVKEKVTPAINDDFARELKRENLADLKKYVKELLENNYAETAKAVMKDRLLDELAREKIEVPESLIEQETEYLFDAEHAREHGVPGHKHDEKAEKKRREELAKTAESRVKLGIIIADIGRREKVEVNDSDMRQAVMREAARYPDQMQRVFEYYQKNPQASEALRAGIFEEKVVDLILSKVKPREKQVKPDELARLAAKK